MIVPRPRQEPLPLIALEETHAAGTPNPTRAGPALLRALQESDIFRSYQRAFESTMGLPLELKRPDSFHFPLSGAKLQNPFCALMASGNRSCASCLVFQQRLHDESTLEARTLECAAGLSESAVPVRAGETLVGFLRTGQVLVRAPDRERLRETLAQVGIEAGSVGARNLEQGYSETRVIPALQYGAALSLLRIFAQHLGALAERLQVEEEHAELPLIAKAKVFIEEKLFDEIRLADVARASSVSPFYFCKLFVRATGMNFTHYLAQRRVEVVKQKLMKPHARVSDVAYATGFQSLSQFNRIFRRVTGESPSGFRARFAAEAGIGRLM